MKLKIAFSGPNLDLCERLSEYTKNKLYVEGIEILDIPNPLREVVEMTKRTEPFVGKDIDWANLWTSVVRRMMLERTNMESADVIIGTSTGLDQIAMQAAWLSNQMNTVQTGLVIADATGQNVKDIQEAMTNRSGAVLQVLVNQTEEEVLDYWDHVYAVLPVVMGVSSESADEVVAQYDDFLNTAPAFSEVMRLPDNEDAAKDVLDQEATKWKIHLAKQDS